MKPTWIVLGVVALLIVVLLFIGGSYIGSKNQMVAKDQNVQAAFSEIDVNLQRRADLIPNLVATVKGYANVEETVLNNIAQARSGLLQAKSPDEKLAANDRLNVALLPLMRLQDELAGTENRIAVARRRYNESIRDYNTFIQQFPNSIWANIAGFHPKNEYYTAEPGSKVAPKVDFSK